MILESSNNVNMAINKLIKDSKLNTRRRSSSPRSSPPISNKSNSDEDNNEKRSLEHKPYGCYYCGFKSGYKYYLVKHMEIHVREKPYTCSNSKCGKQYDRKEYLNAHALIRNGDQTFGCLGCKTPFTYGLKAKNNHDMY